MPFKDDSYKRRLIESRAYSDGRIETCLNELSVRGVVELVPDSHHEDEQQAECEATFRHCSGAYLLYARHLNTEQLDMAVPPRLSLQEVQKMVVMSLNKDIGELIASELYN